AAGNVSSMIFFTVAYMRGHGPLRKNSTLDFKQYMKYALPIMGGGVLTTFLSSTNDALIPYCLRQNGDSTTEALSRFGIFEAIVIPTLFFPSVVLCSMSGIIVSETARASAAGNSERIQTLSGRIKDSTIMYAVFASAVLIRFGRTIGELIGGGELAGEIISLTAPVIPFIYLEIVLEAIIKGTGQQAFSSLNYLAEYIIRISSVLIIVPRIGFYGVVFSYYASNIIGNISRFIFLTRTTGMKINFIRSILVPVVYSFMTLSASELIFFLMHIDNKSPVFMVTEVIIWGAEYYTIMMLLGKIKINRTVNKKAVVHI
ncbi:MAG: polysaccharide biosynthesis C-terminal domain-containing protein, partial [Ruminococcus sp.]|nr:polysaccharide biosynthesis C-terminal domain-containing protein [Ruminococcus sp.]